LFKQNCIGHFEKPFFHRYLQCCWRSKKVVFQTFNTIPCKKSLPDALLFLTVRYRWTITGQRVADYSIEDFHTERARRYMWHHDKQWRTGRVGMRSAQTPASLCFRGRLRRNVRGSTTRNAEATCAKEIVRKHRACVHSTRQSPAHRYSEHMHLSGNESNHLGLLFFMQMRILRVSRKFFVVGFILLLIKGITNHYIE